MTGPDNSTSSTRPISVAELLAKNGTIGAPPVGGRRRRRRGNENAVTVAELTGEIPIVTDEAPAKRTEPAPPAEPPKPVGRDNAAASASDTRTEPDGDTDEYADAVAEYSARVEADDELDGDTADLPETSDESDEVHESEESDVAEAMSPDPSADDEDEASAVDVDDPADLDLAEPDIDAAELDAAAADDDDDDDELPSYLRSTQGPLFGGQTVADDLARRGTREALRDPVDTDDEHDRAAVDLDSHHDTDLDSHHDTDLDPDLDGDLDDDLDSDVDDREAPTRASAVLRGAWIVGQCILAVAFGAGLFIAFDQLWMWNNIVALVLSVLVILGLVVGVRVVRKTEDIGSTLIAVAVGALVTLGPLALLQSG